MNNKLIAVFCILATALLPVQVRASDSFIATGMGTLSCGKVLEAINTGTGRTQVSIWMNGVVTGYNFYASAHVSPPDDETSIAFIKNYCSNNPLSNIVAGTAVMVQDLGGPKVSFKHKH